MSDAAELKALVKKLQSSSQESVRLIRYVNPVTFAYFILLLFLLGRYFHLEQLEIQLSSQ
jgi:hypothetical protein